MAKKRSTTKYRRRDFLKQAAVGGVLTTAEVYRLCRRRQSR